MYYAKCPNEGCKNDYVGETKRSIVERMKDLNSRDNISHIETCLRKSSHPCLGEIFSDTR